MMSLDLAPGVKFRYIISFYFFILVVFPENHFCAKLKREISECFKKTEDLIEKIELESLTLYGRSQ